MILVHIIHFYEKDCLDLCHCIQYFLQQASDGVFDEHDIQNGVDSERVYRSDDYRNLYHLVTHSEQRTPVDIGSKYIIAGLLVRFLKAAGYFEKEPTIKNEVLIGESQCGNYKNLLS